MSSPPTPVLEPVQGLANYLAFMQQRNQEIDYEGETYTRLSQGLSAGQQAEAQRYADAARLLHRDLLSQPPDVALADLPSYDPALGLSPVANVLHRYGEREEEGERLTSIDAFRSDQYELGPGSTAGGLLESATDKANSDWTPPYSEQEFDLEIEFVLPFQRRTGM